MGLIDSAAQVNDLAAKEPDTGGVYFVTAFSGLLAPYWDSGAAGLLIGVSQYTNPSHIARATLEAKRLPDARDHREHEARLGLRP